MIVAKTEYSVKSTITKKMFASPNELLFLILGVRDMYAYLQDKLCLVYRMVFCRHFHVNMNLIAEKLYTQLLVYF